MKEKKEVIESNQIQTPLGVFLASYNKNLPVSFPHASVAKLKKFQIMHPTLFKDGDVWSVVKHRKRLIDWLSSYEYHRG